MKLAVALIHGIGDQPDSRDEDGLHSYARELVAALRRRLGAEAGEVAFQSLYWASVLDARERTTSSASSASRWAGAGCAGR